jgi:5-formyltetrahydrofolate cyclo-ligase
MSVEKRAIRQQLRERRRTLSARVVEAASLAACVRLRTLPTFQVAASIVAYIAHENEISPAPLKSFSQVDRCTFRRAPAERS